MLTQEILPIIASAFNVASMTAYSLQLRRNQSIPNPATWLIWLAFTIVNFLTYFSLTNSVWVSLLAIVNMLGTTLLFMYSLYRGKFAKVGAIEIWSLVLALAVGVYWKISGNAALANVSLQFVLLISYCPTYIGLAKRTLQEKPLSWIFSVFGYLILTLVVFLQGSSISVAALAFPLMNVILNSVVVGFALLQ